MFRASAFLVCLLLVASPAAAERAGLGIFFRWGAFREEPPKRCFAISEPYRSTGAEALRPFATISFWPDRGVRGQVHFRLSRSKRAGSAVLLRIDDHTFLLTGGGANAWAPDHRADADIVAAMRGGVEMSVETRSDRGLLVRDQYRLRGAATAIDAAAVGCTRQR